MVLEAEEAKKQLGFLGKYIPRKHRKTIFVVWVGWKIVATLIAFLWVAHSRTGSTQLSSTTNTTPTSRPRLLFTVTSLSEYNNGRRNTIAGQDRLHEVVLPNLKQSLDSLQEDYDVDLYLILAYTLLPRREQLIRDFLSGTQITIWDDACPIGYDKDTNRITNNTRALSRQHRYVVKDHLFHYDLFLNFEDDMRITKFHVSQYLRTTRIIASWTDVPLAQRERLIPGFVRVEVVPEADDATVHNNVSTIPCCGNDFNSNRLVLWETAVQALYVYRHDYILLPGPGKRLPAAAVISNTTWTGQVLLQHGDTPPRPAEPHLIAQQGGWMATREQILQWQAALCPILPPFDEPAFRRDGQESNNVEFWSGSYQLFTGVKGGCNLRRVVELGEFEGHLLYHTANNKQRQLSHRLVRVEDLVAQLYTVQASL